MSDGSGLRCAGREEDLRLRANRNARLAAIGGEASGKVVVPVARMLLRLTRVWCVRGGGLRVDRLADAVREQLERQSR